MSSSTLFLFYEEPDPDRWIVGDHFPRRFIRRLLRGRPQPGGVMRWFLNLRAGLDQLGISYRINDYRGLQSKTGAWAHVVGKPHVIGKIPPGHPILYGPGVAAHPFEDNFWLRADIRLILLSCDWFRAMYDAGLPRPVPTAVWPAGVETGLWLPPVSPPRNESVLIYDKIRWQREELEPQLLAPVRSTLEQAGLTINYLRYGAYREEEFRRQLRQVSAMVFFCEHETQGFAYLQTLSCGVPILAWDRGGEWRDPSMYPHRVRFGPVTSVPYFDSRCGMRFADLAEFHAKLPSFLEGVRRHRFNPREFVTAKLDLARQAQVYLDLSAKAQRAG